MKIWINDQKVIRDIQYTLCIDCALCRNDGCLASTFNLNSPLKLCLNGYKYEIDV
jgi:hypothetical protein